MQTLTLIYCWAVLFSTKLEVKHTANGYERHWSPLACSRQC